MSFTPEPWQWEGLEAVADGRGEAPQEAAVRLLTAGLMIAALATEHVPNAALAEWAERYRERLAPDVVVLGVDTLTVDDILTDTDDDFTDTDDAD